MSNINGIEITKYDDGNSYFIFQIFVKKNKRDLILKVLKKNSIGVSVHYMKALPEMSYYRKKYKIPKKNYINALQYGLKHFIITSKFKIKGNKSNL